MRRNKSAASLLTAAIGVLLSLPSFAQDAAMSSKRLSTGEEVIVFQDPVSGRESSMKVDDYNPYKNLAFRKTTPAKNSGADYEYNLQTADKTFVLAQYFPKSKRLSNGLGKLSSARAIATAQPRKNFTTITYLLSFYNEDNSLFGIKSKLVIVNAEGKVISRFEEKEQPQYNARVTANGKFAVWLEGDIAPESFDHVIEQPSLKIYEIGSNKKVFELAPSDDSSVLPPSTFDDMFVLIQRKPNGYYTYRIVDPAARVIYKRDFTRKEVGSFLEFSTAGLRVRTLSGSEELLAFDKDFTRELF